MPLSHSLAWGENDFVGHDESGGILNGGDGIHHSHRAEPGGLKRKFTLPDIDNNHIEPVLIPQSCGDSAPKRLCTWSDTTFPQQPNGQVTDSWQDSLPGCLKDNAPTFTPSSVSAGTGFQNLRHLPPHSEDSMEQEDQHHHHNQHTTTTSSLQQAQQSSINSSHTTTTTAIFINQDSSVHASPHAQVNGIASSKPIQINHNTSSHSTVTMAAMTLQGSHPSMDMEENTDHHSHEMSSTPPHEESPDGKCKMFDGCSGLRPSPITGRLRCHCYASWRGMYGYEAGYCNDYY